MNATPLFWAGFFAFIAGFLQAHRDIWPDILNSYDKDEDPDDGEE
jgi:hypothetical protein